MKKYRLKPEAVPFFEDKLATAIHDYDVWKEHHVDEKALEEVEAAYLSYGIKTSENSSSLGGWSNPETNDKEGSCFCFTIHFPSTKYHEHDQFSNGKITRGLMDVIQRQVNHFYEQFNNGETE